MNGGGPEAFPPAAMSKARWRMVGSLPEARDHEVGRWSADGLAPDPDPAWPGAYKAIPACELQDPSGTRGCPLIAQ